MSKQIMAKAWHAFLWLNWLIIFWYWWQGSGDMLGMGWPSLGVASGRLAGLAAAYMILMQFFFMGRTPWLERVFGLDKLARLHHLNGQWGLILLLLHPILLTVGYSSFTGLTWWKQFYSFINGGNLHVSLAAVSLLLFIVVVVSSIYIVRTRLRYEAWYFVHLLAYLAVFFSFWHQFTLGTDLLASKVFYGYWVALYVFVFANHLVFRFIRPVYNYYHHKFFVVRVVRENYSAVSIYIGGRDLSNFRVHPGQFMILRFLTKGLWWQAHPFSLSMTPNGQELRVTIKELGDFTKSIANLASGTKLMIDGPYGVFTELFAISQKILFIAGGIGITPIRSLLEQMARRGKDVILLYSNKSAKDIVFKEELDKIAAEYKAKVVHVVSDDPAWNGEKGRIDQEKLERLVPGLSGREVFLCGPPTMMDAMVSLLQEVGIPLPKIHFEKFSL